jgi:hypothetical protein
VLSKDLLFLCGSLNAFSSIRGDADLGLLELTPLNVRALRHLLLLEAGVGAGAASTAPQVQKQAKQAALSISPYYITTPVPPQGHHVKVEDEATVDIPSAKRRKLAAMDTPSEAPVSGHWVHHCLVPALRRAAGRPCVGEAAPSRGPGALVFGGDGEMGLGFLEFVGSSVHDVPALESVRMAEGSDDALTSTLAASAQEVACMVLEACLLPRSDPHPLLDCLGLRLAGRASAQDLLGASVPALKYLGPHTRTRHASFPS